MIIGKSLTALGGSGLKPEIIVTAKAGALLNLHYKDSSIILQSYQLGADETQHTFVVSVSETAYVVEDVTNGKRVEVLVDTVAQYDVEIVYTFYLYNYGDECEDITGGWINLNVGGTVTKNSNNFTLSNQPTRSGSCILQTANIIDTTKFTKLCAELEFTTSASSSVTNGVVSISKNGTYDDNNDVVIGKTSNTNRGIFEATIEKHSSDYYGHIKTYGPDSATTRFVVYKVWLK